MSARNLPGLISPDPVLERDMRTRLGEVETALEKAVRAASGLLAETAQHLLAAGGKRFRPMLVLLSGYFGDPTDPRLIPGSVAIELVFNRPGIGTLLISAIGERDYAVIQGGIIVFALCVVVVNLAIDLLYIVVDPRIRVQ